jgi:N-acetylneuraminate synthase
MTPFMEKLRAATPYVIAEIGVNHEGVLEKALELITLAKKGGADAAKFQTYKAGKIASKHSPSYWTSPRSLPEASTSFFKNTTNSAPKSTAPSQSTAAA